MRTFIVTLIAIIFNVCLLQLSYALPKDCIIINIPSRTLDLYKDGKLKKTYPVGVGKANFPTPVGNFKVIRLVKGPGWENPYKPMGETRINAGKNNPLGTRWIGFKEVPGGEFGIHGTDNPASVGKYCSHGCVRMLIKDSEELFDNISMETPVFVTYETVRIYINNSNVYIKAYQDEYKIGKNNISNVKDLVKQFNNMIIWNASLAMQAIKTSSGEAVKIGTLIDKNDFE